jgi:phosphoribosylformylglycinamidine synthase
MHVYRCFTEKRPGFDVEARGVFSDLREFLGIKNLAAVRLFNRYDIQGISRQIYEKARTLVFSEPQVDDCYDEALPEIRAVKWILPIEALPGQYDQRADSCEQCIQMMTCLDRPRVKTAKVYVFCGPLTEDDKRKIEEYMINPVETRRASMDKPSTLVETPPAPKAVPTVDGFIGAGEAELQDILTRYGLATDIDDLRFMQRYFRDEERRDPTETELRVIDTYWSDHCRHTTFLTHLESVEFEHEEAKRAFDQYLAARKEVYGEEEATRPMTLMDMATIVPKALRRRGKLENLDESEEVNACSIRIDAEVDGRKEDWLLMFKNETHNHPTEIEPFGGAATCIGGAIRDPLSGRAYVYQAMRVTGAGDPRAPIEATLPGKIPQRKLTVTAAQGYSSYGNQIGVATGLVHEVYHPGYIAKRMEIGAVVGAAPAENVVRERPAPGDKVILLGGRTGRDGIGGATGSSKTHNDQSLTTMASEVQKGNAPEERKIQRLFLDPEVTRLIKRCNDFGAGGVSVAIGELADGLDINLSLVRKKYDGLDGTELAISESQERMAVVVAAEDAEAFIAKAAGENLEAYIVAEVTETPRMVMRWQGEVIVNLSRSFLSSNGSPKRAQACVMPPQSQESAETAGGAVAERLKALVSDLRFSSQKGLAERFDASVGAGTVLAPYGGKTQKTPTQVMAALLPVTRGETTTCSVMSFAYNPYHACQDPFGAAREAVILSVAKLVAAGCDPDRAYLTFQEYFERLRKDPARWGKPVAALLGALEAQFALEIAAIGGKDSMSGSFNELDVPPALVSFAIAPSDARHVLSPEFKQAGSRVVLFPKGETIQETKGVWKTVRKSVTAGKVLSAWAVTEGGIAEGLFKMAVGNMLGFTADADAPVDFFRPEIGAIIAEVTEPVEGAIPLGTVTEAPSLVINGESVPLDALIPLWEGVLEPVFPTQAKAEGKAEPVLCTKRHIITPKERFARPRAAVIAFPGTNCEIDTARAVERAGGRAQITVVRNLTSAALEESVLAVAEAIRSSQILILPGGFSGGDEPDGSAKFITAFFRSPRLIDAVHQLLYKQDGLILGICNGFQALIKLGLVPYGEIVAPGRDTPTLTFNTIARHQAKYVYTRVASVHSPWMSLSRPGDVHVLPISHGEGRFTAPEELIKTLRANGQIATQYCDENGNVSMDIATNPNGSAMSVEGLFSPDGRVFGKMCHTERSGEFVARNICGERYQPIFDSGVRYFI